MTNRHILIAKTEDDAWFMAVEQNGQRHLFSGASASCEGPVRAAIKMMRSEGDFDLSFTTKRGADLLSEPLPQQPEELLAAAPGASIVVLAPEGRADDPTMWASCERPPTGGICSAGIASRFRKATLADRVEAYFTRNRFESFRDEKPSEKAGIQRLIRPAFDRLLLVRHDWQVRAICPDAWAPGAAFAAAR